MAPATDPRPTALIVAHGQPSNPVPAEAALEALAGRVNLLLPNWRIASATMAAKGALKSARLQYPAAAIYPLFMADGWFTATALPARLADKSDQSQQLLPLGMDRHLPALAVKILTQELAVRDWQMSETCLIIAAHGGRTSKNPAKAARKFTDTIKNLTGFADIRLGFIEETPGLSQIAADTGQKTICLPFFAANGRHVRRDVPTALRAAKFRGVVLNAIGHDARIPDLIARSLQQAISG